VRGGDGTEPPRDELSEAGHEHGAGDGGEHTGGLGPGPRLEADAGRHQPGAAAERISAPRQPPGAAPSLAHRVKARKTPSRPSSWANSSRFKLHSRRNAWANLHILGQPNTLLARGQGLGAPHALRVRLRVGVGAGRSHQTGVRRLMVDARMASMKTRPRMKKN
jgi:hypothetical protein